MMMCKRNGFRLGLLMAVALIAAPSALTAQAREPDPAQASALEAEARRLHDAPARSAEAARLYREAADLREDHDEVKLFNLRMAMRMAHYAGRPSEALRHAEEAGRLALRRGELLEAGQALADAAHLAKATGARTRALALSEEVRLLAGSPFLAEAERSHLLRRIGEAT